MRWSLILLVLLATSTRSNSWESKDISNQDNGIEDRPEDEGKPNFPSIADEVTNSLEIDDTAFTKTAELKISESTDDPTKFLETNNLTPVNISFPIEKVLFTTDHMLPSDLILTTNASVPTSTAFSIGQGISTDKNTTDKNFSTQNSTPTVPDSTVNIESTNKPFSAVGEFSSIDNFSANKSLLKLNDNIRAKKYEKMFPNNYKEAATTVKPANNNLKSFYRRKKQQFTFWNNLKSSNVTRRMFGGSRAAPDAAQGRAVALVDKTGQIHCSGTALTRLWVLTVAHCLSRSVKFALTAQDPRHVPIRNLYTHRYYRVQQKDAHEGGLAVTSLQHDIGLAETMREVPIPNIPALNLILADMQKHFVDELNGQDVAVFGFEQKQLEAEGAQLFALTTKMVPCRSHDWVPCVCGSGDKGVCIGDSGGPVFYKDAQVALTSLGPMSCAPSDSHSSVFTTLQTYVPLLRSTVPSMPEFPFESTPPRPTEPNPEDYWNIIKVNKGAPCVVGTKLLFVFVVILGYAL